MIRIARKVNAQNASDDSTDVNDPLFDRQWYLLNTGQTGGTAGDDLNVVDLWQQYTGAGIKVGVVDDGVEYSHPDLRPNYDSQLSYDVARSSSDPAPGAADFHGTAIAGIIAAAGGNGTGTIGVAPNAAIVAIRFDPTSVNTLNQDAAALQRTVNVDVANNSWGASGPFVDDFFDQRFQATGKAISAIVQQGRNGLGTVLVFAGGNGRQQGDNSNYHNLQNSADVIAVAALDHNGKVADYSNPGANLLVSAFGGDTKDGIVTTDRLGAAGYNLAANTLAASDYTDRFDGTSAATPMVSGVVALMLQANPNLGYRDVQEILAASARQIDSTQAGWNFNGTTHWNGGGFHVNQDYGFGLVDAHAAVRLAETWTQQSTAANQQVSSATRSASLTIPAQAAMSDSVAVSAALAIDHVEVTLHIENANASDLQVFLTAPTGTQSLLLDRPGVSPTTPAGLFQTGLDFTFSTTHDWGEVSTGNWTLNVRDLAKGQNGILRSWSLKLDGNLATQDKTYLYTNEYASLATDFKRTTLNDPTGNLIINAAAITSGSVLNLRPGTVSTLAGKSLTIGATTTVKTAFTGDGNDIVQANDAGDVVYGGRGNDTLVGGAGDDLLAGGEGNDQLTGGKGRDRFLFGQKTAFAQANLGIDTVTDFVSGEDQLELSKYAFTQLSSQIGTGFSVSSEFATVATDADAGTSSAVIVYSQSSGNLFYNPDANAPGYGAGGAFAILKGTPKLTAGDFRLR